jgi:hypothetical protein
VYVIDFLEQRKTLSKDQFVARHPDPVLILQSPESAATGAGASAGAGAGASGAVGVGGGGVAPGPGTPATGVPRAADGNAAGHAHSTRDIPKLAGDRFSNSGFDEDSEESTLVGPGAGSLKQPLIPRPKPGGGGHDTLTTLASMKSTVLLKRAAESMLVLPVRKTGVNLYQDKITVGRASNNDVILPSPSVSKFHAYFRRGDDGRFVLTDGGSKNGTFINWQPLAARKSAALSDGMELIFGEVSTRYHEAGGFFDFLGRFLAAK